MKVKKYAMIFAAFVFCMSASFAQIRSYVGIVREKYHPDTVSFLKDFSESMRKAGYVSYSKAIDSCAEGGFGSGFVYVTQNGENYIVTNRHVVSQANTVTVEFVNEDGSSTTYEGLTVYSADEDIDLAVLAFPDGARPFDRGLTFYNQAIRDGDEIWSAGFPGLGGKPVWQFGKGNVTNAVVYLDDIADMTKTSLIQHSAQVDPGNSGGPLLVVSDSAPAGYVVARVNTLKAVNRQAANYAIPASVVETFLARVFSKASGSEDTQAEVSRRGTDFVAKATSGKNAYEKLAKFISYEYVVRSGEEAFKNVLQKAPSAARSNISGIFSSYSPIEGLRYAIAYSIEQDLSGEDGSIFLSPGTVSAGDDGTYSIEFVQPDRTIATAWKREHGQWRMTGFNGGDGKAEKKTSVKEKKAKKAEKTDFSFKLPFSFAVEAEYGLSPAANMPDSAELSFFSYYVNIFGWGGFINYQFGNGTTVVMGPTLRLQLPLVFSWGAIVPYAQANLGGGISVDDSREQDPLRRKSPFEMMYSFGGGVYYCLPLDVPVYVGLGYVRRGSFWNNTPPVDEIAFRLGVGF